MRVEWAILELLGFGFGCFATVTLVMVSWRKGVGQCRFDFIVNIADTDHFDAEPDPNYLVNGVAWNGISCLSLVLLSSFPVLGFQLTFMTSLFV
jgi:hypothetical protein